MGTCSVQITALLLPRAVLCPGSGSWGACFGERGLWLALAGLGCAVLHCSAWGAARGSHFTRELESCESVMQGCSPLCQLLQGLQAGRPPAQASHRTHQTGQVTEGFAPAPGTAVLGTRMGTLGGWELCVGGKRHPPPPSSFWAQGSLFSTCRRDLAAQGAVRLCWTRTLVFSREVWLLAGCLWQESEHGTAVG